MTPEQREIWRASPAFATLALGQSLAEARDAATLAKGRFAQCTAEHQRLLLAAQNKQKALEFHYTVEMAKMHAPVPAAREAMDAAQVDLEAAEARAFEAIEAIETLKRATA